MSRLVSLYISCLVSWTFSEQWFDVFHQLNIYKTLFFHILLLPWSLSPFFLFFSVIQILDSFYYSTSLGCCVASLLLLLLSFFPVAQFKLISTDLLSHSPILYFLLCLFCCQAQAMNVLFPMFIFFSYRISIWFFFRVLVFLLMFSSYASILFIFLYNFLMYL